MPGFLLDTNVISELMKIAPKPKVLAWISAQAVGDLDTAAITSSHLAKLIC